MQESQLMHVNIIKKPKQKIEAAKKRKSRFHSRQFGSNLKELFQQDFDSDQKIHEVTVFAN